MVRKGVLMPETPENNPEDYFIRVRPGLNIVPGYKGVTWDGTVSVDIMWNEDNPLIDDDFGQLMNLTQMMCSSVPVMENDETIAKIMSDYVDAVYNDKVEDKPIGIVGAIGNVIKVNFKTKDEVVDGKR